MIRWLFSLLGVRDAPDPGWRPTGYRSRFTGHDEALGATSVERATRLDTEKRRIEALRSRPAVVVPRDVPTCVNCLSFKLRWKDGSGNCWKRQEGRHGDDATCEQFAPRVIWVTRDPPPPPSAFPPNREIREGDRKERLP